MAQERIPSYFELETEVFPEGGHVLRFDSFSKLLAAGMRLGFASGPKEILHAIDVLTAGTLLPHQVIPPTGELTSRCLLAFQRRLSSGRVPPRQTL